MCLMLNRRTLSYEAHHMYSSAISTAAVPAGSSCRLPSVVASCVKCLHCQPACPRHSLGPCCVTLGVTGGMGSDAQEFAEARRAAACADAPRCTYIHPGVRLVPSHTLWTCTKPVNICTYISAKSSLSLTPC